MKRVDELQAEIDCLTRERNGTIEQLQAECDHPLAEVREIDYVPSKYGSTILPYRLCLRCGYAEEGWGCGYWRLCNSKIALEKGDPPGMKREESRKYIRTFLSQRQMSEMRFQEEEYGEQRHANALDQQGN